MKSSTIERQDRAARRAEREEVERCKAPTYIDSVVAAASEKFWVAAKDIDATCEFALLAFWAEVAKRFPLATSGDFPADADYVHIIAANCAMRASANDDERTHFAEVSRSSVVLWVDLNLGVGE